MRILLLPVLVALLGAKATSNALLLERSPSPLQAEARSIALVPWETPIAGFFIRTHHPVPNVDKARWRLVIDGLVDRPLSLSLADLGRLNQKSLHAVLECSGNKRSLQKPDVPGIQWERGAVGNAEWSGVALRDLLQKAGIKSSARFVTIEGADKPAMPGVPAFVRSIPLDKALQPNSLIALQMNRVPLPLLHGGPARVVFPGWYAESWIKWVTRITLTKDEDTGFYMKNGYRMPKTPVAPLTPWDSTTGTPIDEILVQSLITEPLDKSTVTVGPVRVSGKAFSGGGPITKVDISSDGGRTWLSANVSPLRKSGGWQEFSINLTAQTSGPLQVWSRATDASGNIQPLEHTFNPGGYMHNSVDKITLQVAQEPSLLATKCFTCHAKELVTSQRLTANQWDGVLKKMRRFGLELDDESVTRVKAELLALPHTPQMPRQLSYEDEAQKIKAVKGDLKKGQALYAQNCAACHGALGQGQIGPRLARALSLHEVSKTIAEGKGIMPGFKSKFSERDVQDMLTWLMKQ